MRSGSFQIELRADRPALDKRPFEKRVGLVVLATDHTSESDFGRLVAGPRIGVHVARIPYENPTTPDNLRRMQPALEAGAALILPGEPLDVICYSCTAASVVIGDAEIERALQAAKPLTPVVTPPLAASKALHRLGARRISVLTPYTVETSRPMADYFEAKGFSIDRLVCLGFEDDREMARIPPATIVELASEAMTDSSDALFLSCTALRAALVIPEIEKAIGRPAVSSNLASAWMCLRLCGDAEARPDRGQLMALPL